MRWFRAEECVANFGSHSFCTGKHGNPKSTTECATELDPSFGID